MKNWIGKVIIIIGLIHISVGLILLWSTLAELLSEGLFNTVHGQAMREGFFWFTFFGVLLIILGAWLNWCERKQQQLPSFLGWSLLGMVAVMLFIMPVSGAWLMLVPIGGIIKRS